MAQDLDSALGKLRIDRSRKGAPRRSWGKIITALAAIGVLIAAWSWYQRAYAVVQVKVARPEREVVNAGGEEVLTASGYVIPREKIEVSSKIIGRVKNLLVDRGQKVKAGDVLIRIDDEEYQAQVRLAEAQVASASARLAELRAGSRPQEIEAARAAVESAEATLHGAELDLRRLENLRKTEVISQQELDKGRTAYDVARGDLQNARKKAELVEKGPRQEQIDAAAAELRQAKASLAFARSQLDYTVIRAPIAGTVLEKLAEKGELVTNVNFGGTRGAKSSVVSMANLDDLQVELDVNENDLPKVRIGQTCEIRLESTPGVVFKGRVDEMAPEADRQKATVQVKVRVEQPRGLVRPEVNAQVTFLADDPKANVGPAPKPKVWVPKGAIVKSATGDMVYVVADGRALSRSVKTGEEGPKGVEVTEGLGGDESVIVPPLDKISNGRRVAIGG